MTGWIQRRRAAHDEQGAILVLALIIVTTISLVVGAVLTRGDGSLRATLALRQVAGSSYAADAAANIAINDLRTGYGFTGNPNESGFNNSLDGVGCFGNTVGNGGTDTLALNTFYPAIGSQPASSAFVECSGVTGTGQQGSPVPITDQNKPGYAIVTLAGDLTASQPLKVRGGIYTNGNIVGPVSVDAGSVKATGTCSGTTVSGTATKQCGPPTPAVTDPGYTDDLGGAVPTLQTPPTSCTGGVAVFTPGYYDNAATLNTASALCNTLWFKPGSYYFDFHNSSCTTYCPTSLFGDQSSNNVWTVPRGKSVVGGTPTDASGNVIAIPSSNPTMPGSCTSPITDINAVGVQFAFGNDSRMFLDGNGSSGAHIELCGSYHADRPPIELLGLKSGGALSATSASGLPPSGTVATTRDAGSWANADAAALSATGGTAATWTTTGNGTKNATLTVPGFVPPTAIPAGAILTGATLNVKHQEAGTATTATLQINGTSGPTASFPLPLRAASTSDAIAFNASTNTTVFNTLQRQIHDNGFSGATATFTAKVTGNGNNTVAFDAVSLDLTYAVPVLRGEAGTCVASGTSCSLVSLDPTGNNKVFMYLQGTTYAPLADLQIVLSNFSAEVAKFGVIARQLEFNVNTGNPTWTGPVFEVPDNSPGYGYQNSTVDLRIHLCPGSATCNASAPVALTSRVQLWDPSGTPSPPKRQVSVLSWNHFR